MSATGAIGDNRVFGVSIIRTNDSLSKWRRRMQNKMMRLGQASRELGLSPFTLRDWAEKGLVPCLQRKGGHRYWTKTMLAEIKNNLLDISNEKHEKVSKKSVASPMGR